MSLSQFLRILMARKSIILATLLACFLAATVTVQLLPARYESTNRVLIDMTKASVFGDTPLTNAAMSSYIATQLKLIKDVQTAGLVVDALGWAADPNNQAAFDAAGRPGGDIRDWLAQRIVDGTEANFVEASSIIEIAYRGTDPVSAQGIAQAVREAFLKLNRDQRVSASQRSAASYEEQARRALVETQRAEEARTQFAKANGIVVQPGNVDLENAKLSALSSATAAPTPPTMSPGSAANPAIAQVKQQIAQAQQTLGPNHPTFQALQRQLAALEQSQGSAPTMIGGTSRADIEAAYQTQKARVLAQADKIDRLSQMQADIAVKRDQYQKLQSKAEEMKGMALAGDTPMEPLGNTNLPDEPVWPNKPLVIAGSIALGLVLGILLALLVELLARRVRSEDDLEFATGAPVLAVVGRSQGGAGLGGRMVRLFNRDRADGGRALAEA